MWPNSSKDMQEIYYKQQEYRKLCERAVKEDRKTILRAGVHDSKDKARMSLDAISSLPRCPECGAKLKFNAKKCKECGCSLCFK